MIAARTPALALRVGLVLATVAATAFAEESRGVEIQRQTEVVDGIHIERDKVEIHPAESVKLRSIDVDNRLGDVMVVGHDKPSVLLEVVKHAPDGETLDRLKVTLAPDPKGIVRVSTALLFGDEARPLMNGVVRIDMKLHVPRAATVDVKAWNGKVDVSHMKNGATLAAHDADITVADVEGAVTTTNTKGTQRLSGVNGAVKADGTWGEVALEEVSGDSLAARLHDGTIVARRIHSRSVQIATTFGDIRFQGEFVAGGRYSLRSYRGNIVVEAGGGSFRLEAYSRDGTVDSRLELSDVARPEVGRLRGTFGARKKPAILEVSSTAGNLQLGLMNE